MTDANEITNIVFSALSDRKGFDDWFDQIDQELQTEIKAEIAEALAALRAQPAGWEPIASAPKDGTEILLGHPDGSLSVGWWKPRGASIGWTDGGTFSMSWPLYWQPLPAAPTGEQRDALPAIGETME